MKEQPTTELLDILNNIDKTDMSAYIKEFAATASAAAPFPEYIAEHGIAIADVVNRCRGILSKSYVYDILNGTKRNPSRDVVLLLCIAVHALMTNYFSTIYHLLAPSINRQILPYIHPL